MEEKPLKQAAIYIRVSTNRQEELSPDSQKRLCLEYARSHNMIVSNEHIYMENGISGKRADKRPEFQRMIAAAKQKQGSPFDIILLWKFSRFARNQEESIVYKSMLRNKCNVDVVSITEPLIDGPFGGLIERIIEWMDEFYSIRLAGDVTRGMTENALRGNYQCSPPLGYEIPYHKAGLRIVPEQADIIRKIYDLYVNQNISIYDITKILNAAGLRTKTGGEFEKRTVEYILENPIYAGYTRWNRVDSSSKQLKEQDEWIIRKGDFESIIDEEIYQQAQNRRKNEYIPKGARPASTTKHYLSGLLKCSACGRTLSYDRRGNYTGFQCYGYSKGKCTVSHAISEKKIVPLVLKSMKEMLESDALINMTILPYSKQKKENSNNDFIQKQLNQLKEKEARIKEAYRNGVDTLEEYKENKELLLKERKALEEQKNKLIDIRSKMTLEEQSNLLRTYVQQAIIILESADSTVEEKRNALRTCIEKITFFRSDEHIEIVYQINAFH